MHELQRTSVILTMSVVRSAEGDDKTSSYRIPKQRRVIHTNDSVKEGHNQTGIIICESNRNWLGAQCYGHFRLENPRRPSESSAQLG